MKKILAASSIVCLVMMIFVTPVSTGILHYGIFSWIEEDDLIIDDLNGITIGTENSGWKLGTFDFDGNVTVYPVGDTRYSGGQHPDFQWGVVDNIFPNYTLVADPTLYTNPSYIDKEVTHRDELLNTTSTRTVREYEKYYGFVYPDIKKIFGKAVFDFNLWIPDVADNDYADVILGLIDLETGDYNFLKTNQIYQYGHAISYTKDGTSACYSWGYDGAYLWGSSYDTSPFATDKRPVRTEWRSRDFRDLRARFYWFEGLVMERFVEWNQHRYNVSFFVGVANGAIGIENGTVGQAPVFVNPPTWQVRTVKDTDMRQLLTETYNYNVNLYSGTFHEKIFGNDLYFDDLWQFNQTTIKLLDTNVVLNTVSGNGTVSTNEILNSRYVNWSYSISDHVKSNEMIIMQFDLQFWNSTAFYEKYFFFAVGFKATGRATDAGMFDPDWTIYLAFNVTVIGEGIYHNETSYIESENFFTPGEAEPEPEPAGLPSYIYYAVAGVGAVVAVGVVYSMMKKPEILKTSKSSRRECIEEGGDWDEERQMCRR